MQMTVTDLMTHPPLIVREDANIRDAVKILLNDCAPQLDVVDAQGQLIGSIPDYELLKAQMAGEGDRAVTRVLTAAAARIDIDSTTDFAAAVFRDARYCRLPVVEDGCVVGQIDRRDVMRLLQTVATLEQPTEVDSADMQSDSAESAIRAPRFSEKQRRGRDAMIGR
jgi:predicted transcriptional regulator